MTEREHDAELVDEAVFHRWLWTAIHPYLGWCFIALGLLFIGLGWWGVASHVVVAEQLPYLASGGLLGVGAIVLGGRFLAMHDLRRDSVRIERLETTVARLDTMVTQMHGLLLGRAEQMTGRSNGQGRSRRPGRLAEFFVVPGGTSYHRADCRVVVGKSTAAPVAAESAVRDGLTPCRLCEPRTGR